MMGCYVIAEAGLNHQGDRVRALEMVHAAAAAGCNGFKVQAYTAREFVGPDAVYTYLEQDGRGGWRRVTEKQREMFDRCALTPRDLADIYEECQRKALTFIVTATDPAWIKVARELGTNVILKVGSDDLVHRPLLQAIATSSLQVILSTGMASESEIDAALQIVRPVILLHCVSLYPTPLPKANLKRMLSLARFGCPVGFSDHTVGSLAAMLAVGMGASMIEKHFTLDKSLPGPDHWFSADPADLKQLVSVVKTATAAMGSGEIEPGVDELQMRRLARRSAVADQEIPAGTRLKQEMVAYRRPGTGLTPGLEISLLGRIARHGIAAGEPLEESAFFVADQAVQ